MYNWSAWSQELNFNSLHWRLDPRLSEVTKENHIKFSSLRVFRASYCKESGPLRFKCVFWSGIKCGFYCLGTWKLGIIVKLWKEYILSFIWRLNSSSSVSSSLQSIVHVPAYASIREIKSEGGIQDIFLALFSLCVLWRSSIQSSNTDGKQQAPVPL